MSNGRPVYSTGGSGIVCPRCRQPAARCTCKPRKPQPQTARPNPADGVVRVRREVAGRRGKPVTTITGVPLDEVALQTLASAFKKRCGCGGSCKGGVIEIQGDHRDALVAELQKLGYAVKLSGG
jgi:translation initiation factor 1